MRRGRMRRRITRGDEIAVFAAKVLHVGFYNCPGPWIGRKPLKDTSPPCVECGVEWGRNLLPMRVPRMGPNAVPNDPLKRHSAHSGLGVIFEGPNAVSNGAERFIAACPHHGQTRAAAALGHPSGRSRSFCRSPYPAPSCRRSSARYEILPHPPRR